jgi:4'-phosphopantetheinyl transferase
MRASSRSLDWDGLLTAVHAWQLRPSELRAPEVRDRWLFLLPADERSQYHQFRTGGMRESYLAARVLCRVTLSRYTGADPSEWRFGKGPHDKPTLVGPDRFNSLRFNLTHTNDLVICVVTRAGEVGVDAEETSRPVDASLVARHFLSRREEARLANLPPRERIERFFEQWVLKEAYVKATGTGLVNAPERLTVEQRDDGQPVSIGGCQFSLHRPDSSHVAAAAVFRPYRTGLVSFEWLIAAEALGAPLEAK